MPGCAAFGCTNRCENGFRLVAFPRNEERRKQWAVAVKRSDPNHTGALWQPTNYSRLCEVSGFVCKLHIARFSSTVHNLYYYVLQTWSVKVIRPKTFHSTYYYNQSN